MIRVYQALITLAMLLVIELCCMCILRQQDTQLPFFINTTAFGGVSDPDGYNDIDALLGWSMTKSQITAAGYQSFRKMILLGEQDSSAIKILITGGSTTDLMANPNNWPVLFDSLLKTEGVKATIYVAGTGGYSSGQELLKLIRDGFDIHPDIHISYSGANECLRPDYTSEYEMSIFNKVIYGGNYLFLIPNTIHLIKKTIADKQLGRPLYNPLQEIDSAGYPAEYWHKNMGFMKAIADQNSYSFYGILQPVKGVNNEQTITTSDEWFIKKYKGYYPRAIQYANAAGYLYDLSAVFADKNAMAFVDDCHLQNDYQIVIAEKVLQFLKQHNALVKKDVADHY